VKNDRARSTTHNAALHTGNELPADLRPFSACVVSSEGFGVSSFVPVSRQRSGPLGFVLRRLRYFLRKSTRRYAPPLASPWKQPRKPPALRSPGVPARRAQRKIVSNSLNPQVTDAIELSLYRVVAAFLPHEQKNLKLLQEQQENTNSHICHDLARIDNWLQAPRQQSTSQLPTPPPAVNSTSTADLQPRFPWLGTDEDAGSGANVIENLPLTTTMPPVIARVFPRRTTATPTDALAFTTGPGLFPPQVDEMHIPVRSSYDMARAEQLVSHTSRMAPLSTTLGTASYHRRCPPLIPIPQPYIPNSATPALCTSLGPTARSLLDRRDARRAAAWLAPIALLPARLGLTPLRGSGVDDPPRLAEGGVIPPYSNGESNRGPMK
jgi:hypothetical protein